ncbi:MAG: GtrA family protein [Lachnospiraceae bacterium]|nr:YfhO family protein [Robinsoniella sp.]MDY3766219.1 GtrA family protein [Lachnospiraceae bacterium]
MEKVKKLYRNQTVRYIFFGGCTTLVNLISYAIFRGVLQIDITVANVLSIFLAILFAYVVNKIFVFESKTKGIWEFLGEMAQFIGMRLSTMFIEVFGVVYMSCVWKIPDMISKLMIQVVVLVLNYVFSKIFVFNEERRHSSGKDQPRRKRRRRNTILGFAIPAVAMTIAFAVNEVSPFGDRGILIIDSLHQYLPFFTEFHEKLVNSESLRYSFGGGLGINFWATFAYYFASPLNFLIVLFPTSMMMEAMALLVILKIGFSGGFFAYYLSRRNHDRNYTPILFACMFALSNFIIGYYFNLMWLDSIAVLPIVMLGIEEIVDGKSGKIFAASLAFALFSNYYIGFMLCVFSCLYFLMLWCIKKKREIRKVLRSCLNFGWYALLSGGMAAIVLIPAYQALGMTESTSGNSFPTKIKLYTGLFSQLTQHFAAVEPITIADTQVGLNAYCGVLVMMLVLLYLLDKNISLRKRIGYFVLTAFLYVSFDVNVLNYIWHGFHTQNGLPNRFAFLYIAMLLVMSFDAFGHIRLLPRWRVSFAFLVPPAVTAFVAYKGIGDYPWYVYVITLLAMAVYLFWILLYRLKKRRVAVMRNVIVCLGVVEMVASSIYGVCCNGTVSKSSYVEEQTAYHTMMERRDETNLFYRMEMDSQRMRNANMFLGGDGMVLFSSTMPAATVDLCKALGIEARTNKNGYIGVTKLMNDVFGIRYIVSKENTETLYQFKRVDYENPDGLFYNEDALSIGFMVNEKVKDWDTHSGTPMEVQNQFINLTTGYEPIIKLDRTVELSDQETCTIKLPKGSQVYVQLMTSVEKLEISTPEYDKTYNRYNDHMYNLGCMEEDQLANVTVTFKEGQSGTVKLKIYVCHQDEYEKVHEALAEEQMELTSFADDHIEGTITAKESRTLMFSIPYDEGWEIKVDGENVQQYRIGEALMGIDLEAGEHQITLSYTPPGLWLGSFLSIVCIALYLATMMMERKNQLRTQRRQPEKSKVL